MLEKAQELMKPYCTDDVTRLEEMGAEAISLGKRCDPQRAASKPLCPKSL